MPLPEKLNNLTNNLSSDNYSDEGEDYEVLPEKEVKDLREELKKMRTFEQTPSKTMQVSMNDLNAKLDKLLAVFDEASKDIKIEEGGLSFQEKMKPLVEKMNKILEQNSEIAEGIVAIADLIRDFRSDLETKGVTVTEKQGSSFAEPSQQIFPQLKPFETQPFPPRMPSQRPAAEMQMQQMPKIAPPPFEAPRSATSPPPMSPPRKRLFGI